MRWATVPGKDFDMSCAVCKSYPTVPCECLTFAEAMGMDPSEVEVSFPDGGFVALDKYKHSSLSLLRLSSFRRVRPKRSRVQEMMDRVSKNDSVAWCSYRNGLTEGVLAVCEYLRKHPTQAHRGHAISCDIEREFLEPK